ncbi:MAG TPA: YraN family protein [Nitrolancea sp.]
MTSNRVALGDAGERLAERRLVALSWQIIERKWRVRGGEIDLIALDGDELVFVEVKTRRGSLHGTAEEAVDARKAARLIALGEQYVGEHPEYAERFWRVDIVAITIDRRGAVDRYSHLRNACVTG